MRPLLTLALLLGLTSSGCVVHHHHHDTASRPLSYCERHPARCERKQDRRGRPYVKADSRVVIRVGR